MQRGGKLLRVFVVPWATGVGHGQATGVGHGLNPVSTQGGTPMNGAAGPVTGSLL